jgi:F0F1-type ATP synthase assembly protein I
LHPANQGTRTRPAKKDERREMKVNMDAKKVSGVLVAVVIGVPVIAMASAETLALIEAGLIGLLFGIRRRRAALRT